MDFTQVLTATISTTTTISNTFSVGESVVRVYLTADPVELFGVVLGFLIILVLFLFVNRFQQWALILSLIAVLVWLPLSLTPLSLVSAGVTLFFVMLCSVTRAIGVIFWK